MALPDWLNSRIGRFGRLPPITLVGHPFSATGRGYHLRIIWRALLEAGVQASVYDLWPTLRLESVVDDEIAAHQVAEVRTGGIRLFHVNGSEATAAQEVVRQHERKRARFSYNIIYPAWEFPRYPEPWARALEQYDEIWTATDFVFDAVRPAVSGVPVLKLRNACEPLIGAARTREWLGLPADQYLVLYTFDCGSGVARKNPLLAIRCFAAALAQRPNSNLHLVLKAQHPHLGVELMRDLRREAAALEGSVTMLVDSLSDSDAKALIGCCDCFLSLHRSEGFGRGPAEAMFLGKPVIATGWSGNMEYMTRETSFPIGYDLVDVAPGDYPFGDGQVWAEPRVEDATEVLVRLADDPQLGREIGARAADHMRREFSNAVLGPKYLARFREIAAGPPRAKRL